MLNIRYLCKVSWNYLKLDQELQSGHHLDWLHSLKQFFIKDWSQSSHQHTAKWTPFGYMVDMKLKGNAKKMFFTA